VFSKSEGDSNASDCDHSVVGFLSFVISCRQPSILLDPVDKDFNGGSPFVHFFVQGKRFVSLRPIGNNNLATPARDDGPYSV
jgi:hypothetical protein